MNKKLSSPNRMVWEYFHALRRLCYRAGTNKNKKEIHQDAALCIILAVTGVEIFLNAYFLVLISEEPYKHAKECILEDLKERISLDKKIRKWPKVVLGKRIQLGSGIGQEFTKLKDLRNKLVHFSSSHEKIELPGVIINGLADTTVYDSLDDSSALRALETAEQFICEIFRLRGTEEANLRHSLQLWTGKVTTS